MYVDIYEVSLLLLGATRLSLSMSIDLSARIIASEIYSRRHVCMYVCNEFHLEIHFFYKVYGNKCNLNQFYFVSPN